MSVSLSRKNWVAIILSGVIALLYSLPWLAIGDQPRSGTVGINGNLVSARVLYLFVTVFLTAVVFFYCNFFFRKILARRNRAIRVLFNVLLHAIMIVSCTAILVISAGFAFEIRAVKAYFIFYLLRNVIIGVVVILLSYILELIERLEKERMEILLLENRNTESELAALRSQIDPHFIFNSLSTLAGLISPANKRAVLFLEHMSDSFRYTMERRSSKLVTLKEELQFLESYLYMMNCRFGDSIRLTIRVDAHRTHLLPQFALQVAVENAIKHNRVTSAEPIDIDIWQENESLKVKNTINKKNSSASYGIGLANLSKRYRLSGKRDIEVRSTDAYFELSLPLL